MSDDLQTVVVSAKRGAPSDDVFIDIDGEQLGGWTGVQITRGLERMPSTFELTTTEKYPLTVQALQVKPGAECTVYIGSDPIVTGYVDRVMPSFDQGQHVVRVVGRGKCADLVDCSAEWPGSQISGANVFEIAVKLAAPYDIKVEARGDIGGAIPQFSFGVGETAWSIIETWCRVRQLLAWERPDGNLQLMYAATQVGAADPFPPAASGFAEGVNIESGTAMWDTAYRYSEYRCHRVSIEPLRELGDGGNIVTTTNDPGIKRHRRLSFVMEQGSPLGEDAGRQRAQWEAVRRFGRAGQIRLVTDAWRDSAGVLYDIGRSVDVNSPSLKAGADDRSSGARWVIAEIQYVKDESGTHAHILLMQRDAFDPAPTLPPQYHVPAEVANLPNGLGRP